MPAAASAAACAHGAWIAGAFSAASSGIQRRTYAPSGSKLPAWVTGLKMRKYGCASVPLPADHCHPPLFAATSPSTRCCKKCASPFLQSTRRSFVRNDAVIMRARLCMKPVSRSCRMAASTMGYPVRPSRHALNVSSRVSHSIASYAGFQEDRAACGACQSTWV